MTERDITDDARLLPRDRPGPRLVAHGCGHPGKSPVRDSCYACRSQASLAAKRKGTLGKYKEPRCAGTGQPPAITVNTEREDIDFTCAVCGYPCPSRTVTPHIRREPRATRSAAEWLVETLLESVDDYQRRLHAERQDH
jgi:hypothetical protein